MSPDVATDLFRETILVSLMIGGPILLVGLIIGLVVGVLQAATQIQEQTLSFVPKIAGMGVAAAVIVPWMGAKLMDFAVRMFGP